MSGNFEKMLANFDHFLHFPCQEIVGEFCDVMSGNFVMTLFLD